MPPPPLKIPPYILRLSENTKKQNKVSKSKTNIDRIRKGCGSFFHTKKNNPGKRNGQFEFWRENSKPSNDDNAQNSDFKFLCQFVFSLQYSIICRQNSLLSSSKKQEENLMMYNIVIANYHLLIITLLLSPYYNY